MAFLQSGTGNQNIHVIRPLTDLVVSFDPAQQGFIRNFFLPRKPVAKLSDQIRQISKPDLLRVYDLKGSAEGRVSEVQFRLDSTLQYTALPYAVQVALDGISQLNADEELQFEQRQTMQAYLALGQQLEYVCINQTLRQTSVMTQNKTLSAAQQWDNFTSSSSDPVSDLLAACSAIRVQTGKSDPGAIKIAMHEFVWNKLQTHPATIDRVRFSGAAGSVLTPEILAGILRISAANIMITSAHYTALQQPTTGNNQYKAFIGSDVLIAHVEPGSLYDFGLGHEFAFSGFDGDSFAVIKYPDFTRGALGSDMVKVVSMVDYKVLNPVAGYLLKGVVNTSDAQYLGYLD